MTIKPINRSKTGGKTLGTDARYNVFDENGGLTEHKMVTLLKAECLCHSHKGWTYQKTKVAINNVGGVTAICTWVTSDMKVWIQDQAYREDVSPSEIIRRCIQAQMDKRNRFYILKSPYNRA